MTRIKSKRIEDDNEEFFLSEGEIALSKNKKRTFIGTENEVIELLNSANEIMMPSLLDKPSEVPPEGKVLFFYLDGNFYLRDSEGQESIIYTEQIAGNGRSHKFKQMSIFQIPDWVSEQNQLDIPVVLKDKTNQEIIRPPLELLYYEPGETESLNASDYDHNEASDFEDEYRVLFDGQISWRQNYEPEKALFKEVYLGKIYQIEINYNDFKEIDNMRQTTRTGNWNTLRYLIVSEDKKVYTADWNYMPHYVCELDQVNKTVMKNNGFTNPYICRSKTLDKIENLGNFKLLFLMDENTYSDNDIMYYGLPKDFVLFPKKDLEIPLAEDLKKVELNGWYSSAKEFKVVFSFDGGNTYHSYYNEEWILIDPTPENVKTFGVKRKEVAKIKNFNLFLKEKKIRVALGFFPDDIMRDYCEIDYLKVYFTTKGTWRSAVHGRDYEYYYETPEKIIVEYFLNKPLKINY